MLENKIQIDLDKNLYSKIAKEYTSGHYTDAIKTAILYLTECIREKTDLADLDGYNLITKAFSVKNPLIKFNNLITESDKNEQIGHMMI